MRYELIIDRDARKFIQSMPEDDRRRVHVAIDKLLDESRIPSDMAQRKAIFEKLTKLILDNEAILYLYHPRVLIAHTTRLEGYRQLSDGLVRVVGRLR